MAESHTLMLRKAPTQVIVPSARRDCMPRICSYKLQPPSIMRTIFAIEASLRTCVEAPSSMFAG